jgi:DNA invertase Pin-like site-specific DNA recombinase/predicted nucleotidyltransferase
MTIYGYATVEKDGDRLAMQCEALIANGAAKVFHDEARGMKGERPGLARLLETLGPGDGLIVTRLDRLARSSRDLLKSLDTVIRAGASFRALGDRWADTTSAHGQLILPILAGLAEFDRSLLVERTGKGRARALARGQHMGRRPSLTQRQRTAALHALTHGTATQADVARQFNVSQSTISRLGDQLLPVNPNPRLDAETERAARIFLKRISKTYAVDRAILFGSRARRTHTSTSDADIAVILKGPNGKRSAAAIDMAGAAFDVMLETGILVEALPLWAGEMEHPEQFSNPALIRTIQREGVAL